MKIHIEIGELVLHGFDYHDSKHIRVAIEDGFTRLITEKGLPKGIGTNNEIAKLDAGSFIMAGHPNPRAIGSKAAKSIYRAWESNLLNP